jgi:2-dehydropantoate 2-reductase
MPSIALIGPGAIGATVAARLAQKHPVAVCVRTPFDHLRIEAPDGVIEARPEILRTPAEARPVDWVLVAAKAYDTEGVAAWLAGLAGPGTRVAILQNGVEHRERFAAHVATEALLPVIVDMPAERLAPGHVHQRRRGTLIVPDGEAGRGFVALFEGAGLDVSTSADFRTQVWRKLVVNSAGAVSALTLKPAGIARDEAIGDIMLALMRECLAVGRAEGAVLEDSLPEEVLAGTRSGPRDSVNSLLADRLAGRRLETDVRNGAVVRIGRRHGIATPVNAMITALLEAASAA